MLLDFLMILVLGISESSELQVKIMTLATKLENQV